MQVLIFDRTDKFNSEPPLPSPAQTVLRREEKNSYLSINVHLELYQREKFPLPVNEKLAIRRAAASWLGQTSVLAVLI